MSSKQRSGLPPKTIEELIAIGTQDHLPQYKLLISARYQFRHRAGIGPYDLVLVMNGAAILR